MRKTIGVLFLALVLAGCGVVVKNINDADNNRGLRSGMSKQEVIALLGTPEKESIQTIEGKEYEVFQYPLEVERSDKVRTFATNYFRVFFLDGRLAQWEKDKVFAQPNYKYPDTVLSGPKAAAVSEAPKADKYLK